MSIKEVLDALGSMPLSDSLAVFMLLLLFHTACLVAKNTELMA